MNQEQLKQILNYDPDTGIFTWKVANGRRVKIGEIAGRTTNTGHRQIGINNKQYLQHRLAWLYVYGTMPSKNIDHINGIRNDNRIANLREATHLENHQNRSKTIKNSTGYLGVVLTRGRYIAQITVDKKHIYLGIYDTKEEAYDAYLKAKSELHTFNPIPRK
jgi:hypothetical protein